MKIVKVGQGFDVHRLVDGRKLILGGVVIDHPRGLDGHSDADVLTHALIDAILGAAGLGDIGMHFPDSDPCYRDACSIELLKTVCTAIESLGLRIANIDATVFAQAPRIGPYRAKIVAALSAATGLIPEQINVKAKTAEGLGFIGRAEGIAASAVALLIRGDDAGDDESD
jgi:2-C-methyl-D-erythritol 2,4-cyclodiphosphate synthase